MTPGTLESPMRPIQTLPRKGEGGVSGDAAK